MRKRSQSYPKPPRWSALYNRHFPLDTDSASRHVKVIAKDVLRDLKSPIRAMLENDGYEPDHWAASMEATVKALWAARAEIRRLRAASLPEGE